MPLLETLINLEKLLRQYDFILEANTVAGAIQTHALDQGRAYQQIINDTWWVGEDAVAEADLSIAGGFTAKARKDQDAFQNLVITLYQQLQEKGYDNEHATLITSQYHKWLVSRM